MNNISRYLCITRVWEVRYKRRGPRLDPPEPKCHLIVWDENIPKPKQDIDQGEMMCFVYNEYGNEPTKRISTTGFDLTFYWGAVVYSSKTQSINALSLTKL